MIGIARDMTTLERVTGLLDQAGWKAFREEALKKVVSHEESLQRLLFKTRTPVDPAEIEYYRGFRQGVMYVLDGLPNAIQAEFDRAVAKEMVQ